MLQAAVTALYRLAQNDSSVVYLSADNGTDYDFLFARDFPNRYFNVGIAEENMVGMASGLAMTGKKVFVVSATPFLAYRAYEFIRNDLCLQKCPVVLLGTGSGLSVGMLGPTHHSTEDLSVLGSIPGLRISCPATDQDVTEAINEAYDADMPTFIRLETQGGVFETLSNTQGLDTCVVSEGNDVTLVSIGSISSAALEVSRQLSECGVGCRVVVVKRFSPFDTDQLFAAILEDKPIVTIEEHSVTGGLGSAVSDALQKAHRNEQVVRVGITTGFCHGYGTQEEMRVQNSLSTNVISDIVLRHVRGVEA